MKKFLFFISAMLLIASCEKEERFICNVVDSEVEAITDTSVTLSAVINASDFSQVTCQGFAIALSGSEEYTYYEAQCTRIMELTIDNLTPNRKYDCIIFIRTATDGWLFTVDGFKTLNESEVPEEPENPEQPENPETPEQPENPETPEQPETPDEPETPEQPEEPDTPGQTPSVGDVYRMGWFELPIEVDTDSNGIDDKNSTYYYAHHLCDGSEKNAQRSGRARNFSVCFSSEHHCPVWVAAPRHKMYVGSTNRTNAYAHDPQIPTNIQYEYKDADSGCNNGHMLGSAERTSSVGTNRQVFYFSNIAPQYSDTFNTGGGAWNNLEDHVDGLVCTDTLYTVIGCYFDRYTDKYGNTGSPKKISFGGRTDVSRPTMFYYALLRTKSGNTGKSVKDCSASELQCAAFVICHEMEKGHKPQAKDIISIEELESLTGFTYFPNVPNAPKSVVNASDWL